MKHLIAVLLGALLLAPARADELRLLAAELPPYTFRVPSSSVSEFPGPGRGVVFDIVQGLGDVSGMRVDAMRRILSTAQSASDSRIGKMRDDMAVRVNDPR